MVAAARPGPPDARVPCPLCGGLIHPVAGKCKHCKADLTAHRAARPAASAPLPALNQAPTTNGHAVHAPVAHAVPPAYDASQPVLPPRPTGHVATAAPTTWRSWPILVIVVAMMAIVAAAVLMAWPTHRDRDGKRVLQPPPAPERMDTQTPPVTPRIDPSPPKAAPQPAPQDPWSPQPSDPPHTPGAAQADPDDDPAILDPFGPAPSQPLLDSGRRVALTVGAHLCQRVVQCGGDLSTQSMCDTIARMPKAAPRACPALRRCLRRIDALDCAPDLVRAGMQLLQLGDCVEAMRC